MRRIMRTLRGQGVQGKEESTYAAAGIGRWRASPLAAWPGRVPGRKRWARAGWAIGRGRWADGRGGLGGAAKAHGRGRVGEGVLGDWATPQFAAMLGDSAYSEGCAARRGILRKSCNR